MQSSWSECPCCCHHTAMMPVIQISSADQEGAADLPQMCQHDTQKMNLVSLDVEFGLHAPVYFACTCAVAAFAGSCHHGPSDELKPCSCPCYASCHTQYVCRAQHAGSVLPTRACESLVSCSQTVAKSHCSGHDCGRFWCPGYDTASLLSHETCC
jgi:hypothetical protein